ncbi:MAG: hypothetical protein JSS66_16505 [Armatimonadetes bacterium]|nr:hypothetical protein [Armatimonadota bacterium]
MKTKGDVYEGIAFTFCKCATVALLLGPFVLPGAAYLAAIFYVFAYFHQRKDTRCVLRYPLLIAALWIVVGTVALILKLKPEWLLGWLPRR